MCEQTIVKWKQKQKQKNGENGVAKSRERRRKTKPDKHLFCSKAKTAYEISGLPTRQV